MWTMTGKNTIYVIRCKMYKKMYIKKYLKGSIYFDILLNWYRFNMIAEATSRCYFWGARLFYLIGFRTPCQLNWTVSYTTKNKCFLKNGGVESTSRPPGWFLIEVNILNVHSELAFVSGAFKRGWHGYRVHWYN